MGVPGAIGILVTLVAALTLGPTVLVISSRFGLLERKRTTRTRGWHARWHAIICWANQQ